MDEDPFEDRERYPADGAQEQFEYQRLAWYAAPWGDAGVALVLLTAAINLLRRAVRQVIRNAARLRSV